MEKDLLSEPTYGVTRTPRYLKSEPRDEHEWSEYLDGFSTLNSQTRLNKDHPVEICWDMFEVPLLLTLIAIISAFIAFFVNSLVNLGNSWRWSLVHTTDDHSSWILYCVWCLFFSLLASFCTQTICKEASGSGLPEMKTILSGVIKPILLSFRLIIAKTIGLSLALIAGLSVGKEGPFVQISGAVADQLMKLSIFQHVRRQDTKRLEMIACACASGVCVTFGTAFGGVLFSIEFTSSAYLTRTLPKAFLTAACAMIVVFWLGISEKLELFNEPLQSKNLAPKWIELLSFVLIGILSGLLGVLFVTFVEFISSLRNRWLDSTKYSRAIVSCRSYLMIGIVSLLTSAVMYYELATFPLSRGISNKTLMDFLFQDTDMKNIVSYLVPYFVYKFIATALSVTLPLPVGLFFPVFLTGGVLGRIIGERLCALPGFVNYAPWEYSLLGAAGFGTGVTRAISTAVIVYELAGQAHLRLPLSVVVLTAYFVGNRFSKNVYDALIDTNGTPYMQELPRKLYSIPVSHVMIPINQAHVLALNSTYKEAYLLLKKMNALQGSMTVTGDRNHQTRTSAIDMISKENDLTAAYHQSVQHYLNAYDALQVEIPHMDQKRPVSIKHYSPSVIPIVKSKKSMVIVGAILREDLEIAVKRLVKMIQVTRRPPVVLGRFGSHDFSDPMLENPLLSLIANHQPSSDNEEEEAEERKEGKGDGWDLEEGSATRRSRPNAIRTQPSQSPAVRLKIEGGHIAVRDLSAKSYYRYQYSMANTQLTSQSRNSVDGEEVRDNIVNRKLAFQGVAVTDNRSDREHLSTTSTSEDPYPQQSFSPLGGGNGHIGSDGEGLSSQEESDDFILHDIHMNETIQFILISHGGRKITPVAVSTESDYASPWKTLSLAVPIDPSPYQIVDSMLLNKVEIIFRMLSLNQAYVTNSGKLVGIINRATLREFLGKHSKRPIDKCLLLFRSMSACLFCGWSNKNSSSGSSRGGVGDSRGGRPAGEEMGSFEEMTPLNTLNRKDHTHNYRSTEEV